MTVAEIIVLPTRDRVRFLLLSGSTIECPISDVHLVKQYNGKLNFLVKNEQGKGYRVMMDTHQQIMKSEYMNLELIMAIMHPEVHKI